MKTIRLLLIVLLLITLALTACSSDEEEQTGSLESEPTEPEPTEPEPTAVVNVPEQPKEKEEVASEEEKPVEAPEISESKGLFDAEAMVENLDDYVLRSEDMPNQYRLVTDGEQHITNMKVINTVGEVEGKRYMAATNRLDGWSLELERVNKDELIPYTIFSQIEVFETTDGAQIAFSPDWFPAYTDEENELSWIEDGCDMADACVVYYSEKLDPATELTTLEYNIAFVYKNVLAQVMGRGLDFDMKSEYVVEAAETLLDKIDAAPMVD